MENFNVDGVLYVCDCDEKDSGFRVGVQVVLDFFSRGEAEVDSVLTDFVFVGG